MRSRIASRVEAKVSLSSLAFPRETLLLTSPLYLPTFNIHNNKVHTYYTRLIATIKAGSKLLIQTVNSMFNMDTGRIQLMFGLIAIAVCLASG